MGVAEGLAKRYLAVEVERAQQLEAVPLISKAAVSKAMMKDASPLHWSSTRVLCMEENYSAARERFDELPLPDGALALARAYDEFQYGTDGDREQLYEKVIDAAKKGRLVKGSLDESFFKSVAELFGELKGWSNGRLLEDMNRVELETDGSFFWDQMTKAPSTKLASVYFQLARKMPPSTKGPSVMASLLYRVVKSGDVERSLDLLKELRVKDIAPALLNLMRTVEHRSNPRGARLISEYLQNAADNKLRLRLAPYQIRMHSRCSDLKAATEVFEWGRRGSTLRFTPLFSAYISALGFHRHGAEAARIFECYTGRPKAELLAGLLNAFVYSGMHAEANELFHTMVEKHGVMPDDMMQHLIIDSMAMQKNLEGIRCLEEKLFVSDERTNMYKDKAKYRHFQRAYASMGATEDVLRMSLLAVKEQPSDANAYRIWMRSAASLPEPRRTEAMTQVWHATASFRLPLVDSAAYLEGIDEPIRCGPMASFIDKEVVEKELKKEEEELLGAGYVPQRNLVEFEMFEEAEAVGAPCRHSERLALAHALATSPHDSKEDIFIRKSHLSCEDCHTAFSLLAKIRNRTIVLVTGGRLHRFEGGKCNCGGHHMY